MAFIERDLEPQLLSEAPPKAIVLYGYRHIGKKTLVTQLAKTASSVRWLHGDTLTAQNQLQFNSTTDVELTLRQVDVIVIDEAQHIQDIGLILKQLVDTNIRVNLGNEFKKATNSTFATMASETPLLGSLVPCPQGEIKTQKHCGKTSSIWNALSCTAFAMTALTCTFGER